MADDYSLFDYLKEKTEETTVIADTTDKETVAEVMAEVPLKELPTVSVEVETTDTTAEGQSEEKVALIATPTEETVKPKRTRKPKTEKTVEKVVESAVETIPTEEMTAEMEERMHFDFRNFYTKGDIIYLVRSDKIRKLKIRTIYKENMIAVEDTGEACQVCYKEREQIFMSNVDAKVFLNEKDNK